MKRYPETYLHIRNNLTGEETICPLSETDPLNLEYLVDRWISEVYCGEATRDGRITQLDGHYYARIMTDNRPPASVCCWDGAGFYIKPLD